MESFSLIIKNLSCITTVVVRWTEGKPLALSLHDVLPTMKRQRRGPGMVNIETSQLPDVSNLADIDPEGQGLLGNPPEIG